MTEKLGVAVGRDWIAELRATDDEEVFTGLVKEIAVAAPWLRAEVCAAAREFGDGWEEWAEQFFILPEPQPSVEEPAPEPSVEVVGAGKPLARRKIVSEPKEKEEAKPSVQPNKEEEEAKPEIEAEGAAEIVANLHEVPAEPTMTIGGLPAVVAPTSPDTSLGRQIQYLVEVMNRKHAVIGNVGGKCRMLDWTPSLFDPEVLAPSFQTIDDFKKRYNDLVPTDQGLKKQGELFLGHRNRNRFDGITFLPGAPWVVVIKNDQVPTTMLNIWKGWGVEPRQGSWRLLQRHVEEILARGDEKVVKYIYDWTAAGYQRPGQKRGVAIVFQGHEGVGKGTYGHVVRKTYGPHGLYISQPSQLTGKFNRHLWTVTFVFADEAFFAGDRVGEGILKSLITDPGMMVEPKGVDAFQVPNYLDLLMASNSDWVVPVGPFGRRVRGVRSRSEVWQEPVR